MMRNEQIRKRKEWGTETKKTRNEVNQKNEKKRNS